MATRKEKIERAKAFGSTQRALRLQTKQVIMQLGLKSGCYYQVELSLNNYAPSL